MTRKRWRGILSWLRGDPSRDIDLFGVKQYFVKNGIRGHVFFQQIEPIYEKQNPVAVALQVKDILTSDDSNGRTVLITSAKSGNKDAFEAALAALADELGEHEVTTASIRVSPTR